MIFIHYGNMTRRKPVAFGENKLEKSDGHGLFSVGLLVVPQGYLLWDERRRRNPNRNWRTSGQSGARGVWRGRVCVGVRRRLALFRLRDRKILNRKLVVLNVARHAVIHPFLINVVLGYHRLPPVRK